MVKALAQHVREVGSIPIWSQFFSAKEITDFDEFIIYYWIFRVKGFMIDVPLVQ